MWWCWFISSNQNRVMFQDVGCCCLVSRLLRWLFTYPINLHLPSFTHTPIYCIGLQITRVIDHSENIFYSNSSWLSQLNAHNRIKWQFKIPSRACAKFCTTSTFIWIVMFLKLSTLTGYMYKIVCTTNNMPVEKIMWGQWTSLGG